MSARKIKYDDILIDEDISTTELMDRFDTLLRRWKREWFTNRDMLKMTTDQNLEKQISSIKESITDSIIN